MKTAIGDVPIRHEQTALKRVYGRLLEQYALLPTLPESEFDEDRLPALVAAMEIVEELLEADNAGIT